MGKEVEVHSSMKVKLHTKKRFLTNVYDPNNKNSNSELIFSANYGSEKNKEWAPYTSALNLTVTVNHDVAERFEIGDEFTLYLERDESE